MTDFRTGTLCMFATLTIAMVLPDCGTISAQWLLYRVSAQALVLVIRDFCDMTLVCVDGHVGWVYKCWIAEAKDVR